MTLKEIIKDPKAKIVDVRTTQEFQSGHINGALNIPLDQLLYRKDEINGLGRDPVIFYCRSGNRSGMAVSYLKQDGIANIFNGGSLDDIQQLLN